MYPIEQIGWIITFKEQFLWMGLGYSVLLTTIFAWNIFNDYRITK